MFDMDPQLHEASITAERTTRYEAETAVRHIGGGTYAAMLERSWWIITGPNGGYVAALILRAMTAQVGEPSRRARSMSVQYLRRPDAGEVTVEVATERTGRSVSNLTARMYQHDKLIAIAMAAFAIDREGPVSFDETDGLRAVFADGAIPPPEKVAPVDVDPERDVPMRSHYDLRWVLGDLPFRAPEAESPAARCGGWLRPVEPVRIDEVVLAAMADAWMPPIFSRVGLAVTVPTVDLTIHFRDLPEDPYGFCFVLFESPIAAHGYTVEHGRIWSPQGRLLAECRQLAVLA